MTRIVPRIKWGWLFVPFLFFLACQDETTGPDNGEELNDNATLLTKEITSITDTSAVSGGTIVSEGRSAITHYGVCWSQSTPVTIEDDCTSVEGSVSEFTSLLTGLEASTTYYVRAYATNSAGTAFGSRRTFQTRQNLEDEADGTVSHGYEAEVSPSQEGRFVERTYTTVQATWDGLGGDKMWTRMNLGATAEPSSPTDQSKESAGWFFQFGLKQGFFMDESERIPEVGWFGSISVNADWGDTQDPCRLLLGEPWRLPTLDEWEVFLNAPAEDGGMGNGTLEDAYNSALKLHAAGIVTSNGTSLDVWGLHGYYWSRNQNNNTEANGLQFNSSFSSLVYGEKTFGLPVRCIQE